MLPSTRAIVLGAALWAGAAPAAPAVLDAQQRRPGMWVAFAVAPAWGRVTCLVCAGDRDQGMSAGAGIGGTVRRGLRLGGELDLWRARVGDVRLTAAEVGAVAYWFPNPRRRFYLKGGVVYVSHRTSDGVDVITATGVGPVFGAGYEFEAGERWRVAPFLQYAIGVVLGGVKNNGGEAAETATVTLLQVGFNVTRP